MVLHVNQMKNKLSKEECKNGYILDGFPRTLPQAKGLKDLFISINQKLDKVIVLKVNDSDIVERMSGRRVHLPSGRVYHIKFNPPKNEGVDDLTNEKLAIRKDDQPETVEKRLKIYHETTKPLIDYYSSKNIVTYINGNKRIEEIHNKIKEMITNV